MRDSRRATVVLPVPGLPVKTRWRLCSSTGRSRSLRSFSTRVRSATRRTSRLTLTMPTRASSSASSSSSGSGGSCGGGGWVGGSAAGVPAGLGAASVPGHGHEQLAPPRLDGAHLGRRRVHVGGGDAERDRQGAVVVGAGVGGAPAAVDVDEQLEHLRGRRPAVRAGRRRRPAAAHVAGSGAAELGVEVRAEGGDELPQLVVGLAAVGGQHRAGDAERLERAVVAEPLGAASCCVPRPISTSPRASTKRVDLVRERIATHCGSRHISDSVGPPFGQLQLAA